MAYPTPVNDQITDAVTQSNVKVVGEAPAMAMGSLTQGIIQAQSLTAQNAVTAQQLNNALAEAVTARLVHMITGGKAK